MSFLANLFFKTIRCYSQFMSYFYSKTGNLVWVNRTNTYGFFETYLYYMQPNRLMNDVYRLTIYGHFPFIIWISDRPIKFKKYTTDQIHQIITKPISNKMTVGIDTEKIVKPYLIKINTNVDVIENISMYQENKIVSFYDLDSGEFSSTQSDVMKMSDIFIVEDSTN